MESTLGRSLFSWYSPAGTVKDEGLNETRDEPPCVARAPRRFGERFESEALVGSGGMGMVFRGRDRVDGQAVALKVLHRQGHVASERFLREAEALAALAHPAIVRYVAHDPAGRALSGHGMARWRNSGRSACARSYRLRGSRSPGQPRISGAGGRASARGRPPRPQNVATFF